MIQTSQIASFWGVVGLEVKLLEIVSRSVWDRAWLSQADAPGCSRSFQVIQFVDGGQVEHRLCLGDEWSYATAKSSLRNLQT